MLELKNICKTFHAGTPDEKRALIDVTLTVEDGPESRRCSMRSAAASCWMPV